MGHRSREALGPGVRPTGHGHGAVRACRRDEISMVSLGVGADPSVARTLLRTLTVDG